MFNIFIVVVQSKVDRVLSNGYSMEFDGSEQVQSLFPFSNVNWEKRATCFVGSTRVHCDSVTGVTSLTPSQSTSSSCMK